MIHSIRKSRLVQVGVIVGGAPVLFAAGANAQPASNRDEGGTLCSPTFVYDGKTITHDQDFTKGESYKTLPRMDAGEYAVLKLGDQLFVCKAGKNAWDRPGQKKGSKPCQRSCGPIPDDEAPAKDAPELIKRHKVVREKPIIPPRTASSVVALNCYHDLSNTGAGDGVGHRGGNFRGKGRRIVSAPKCPTGKAWVIPGTGRNADGSRDGRLLTDRTCGCTGPK